ncbi:MAG TPA: alpha-galactosidase [Candidatus Limnocylindrales bacterium]|jgi:alpha-galactosidase
MVIEWSPETRELHLRNDLISYVVRVLENGWLGQVYFGPALADGRSYGHLVPGEFYGFSNRLGEAVPLEYPSGGGGDYRIPAVAIELSDGSGVLDLRYTSHRVLKGKPATPGLPSTYVEVGGEAETLEVLLTDAIAQIQVRLLYTIYRDRPVIVRSVRITNSGKTWAIVRCSMSASLDLPDSDWELISLSGEWSRECHVERNRLRPGRQSVSSLRGASSHQHNPFVALARPNTNEASGEAIGLSLVYSGNFIAEAEVESFGTTRLRTGINPDGFSWVLEPGAEFSTPEAVLAYSAGGLGGLSDAYHSLFRERLVRGQWRDRARPVVINNWEATYFDFDEARLLAIATAAKEMGIELFVLDDGWFGERNDDSTSLGDWQVNLFKLPGGLDSLARKVEALGLRFGIWIEPEMVSRASRLFAEHPDWAIGILSRPRSEGRNQYVLDLSRPEVVDHLFEVLSAVLGSAPITYVKWDMNRNITEPHSPTLPAWRQGEFLHRYILGVYQLYDRLTRAFPGVLFESCAGGGGRFDPGMLAFAPQTWTSDDTDAIERLRIQWGTSMAYPLSSMAAHVSAVPNHQVGRVTPLATRAAVAFFGVFGYELDPTVLSGGERAEIAGQVAFYKQWRELFQRGRFRRLLSPFEGDRDETAWMVVADEARAAIVGHYQILARPNPGPRRLRLRGLDAAASYRVSVWLGAGGANGAATGPSILGGDELMSAGLVLDSGRQSATRGDFQARLYVLEAIEGANSPEVAL